MVALGGGVVSDERGTPMRQIGRRRVEEVEQGALALRLSSEEGAASHILKTYT